MKRYLIALVSLILLQACATPARQETAGPVVSPAEVDYAEGWKSYSTDDMLFLLNLRNFRQYGSYWLMNVYIENKSDGPRALRMSDAAIGAAGKRSPFLSYEQYMKKVRRRENLKQFGVSFASMAAATAVDIAIDGEIAKRGSGYGNHVARRISSLAVYGLASMGAGVISERFRERYEKTAKENIGYLHDYTIPAGTAVEGHALAKVIRSDKGEVVVTIPVDGKVYAFRYSGL